MNQKKKNLKNSTNLKIINRELNVHNKNAASKFISIIPCSLRKKNPLSIILQKLVIQKSKSIFILKTLESKVTVQSTFGMG